MIESHEIYWAADEVKVAVGHLKLRVDRWSDLYNNSFKQAWVRNYFAYYSPMTMPTSWDTSLVFQGQQGELLRMYTPEARVAINRLKAVISKQRLSFQTMAQVGGSDVSNEIKIGNALCDQIVQVERLDIKAPEVLEGSLVTGKWFIKTIWNSERGDPMYRDGTGKILMTGGPEITPVSIFDCFYDVDYPIQSERPWMMTRVRRNRWDLVAEHPDLADAIRQLPPAQQELDAAFWFDARYVNYDIVLVYEFYHRPSPSLPDGRIIIFSDENTIYYDDINRYRCVPIEEMSPESVLGVGLGYPKMTDLMGSQEMLDNTLSAIATNSSQFAVQNVLVSRNSNINLEEINGMRFIQYTPEQVPGGGKPEALNLSQTAAETFKFADLLSSKLDKLSLLNGVLQGQLPAGVTSGTAIATLSASAIESMNPYMLCYYYALEKTMWHALNAFQRFGDAFQTLRTNGVNSQTTGVNFNKESIKNLSGVKIITTNPLMQTISGRIDIAKDLMQTPKDMWGDYIAIIEGQSLQTLTKGAVSKKDLIELENEQMMQGNQVPVLATDNHAEHIKGHSIPLDDPSVRVNGKVNQVLLNHIMEHYTLAKQTAPDLLYMAQTGMMPPMGAAPGSIPQGAPAALDPSTDELGPTQGAPGMAGGDIAEPAQDQLGRS